MGCDYYENVILKYKFSIKDTIYEGNLIYETKRGYIYIAPTESFDEKLSEIINDVEIINLNLDKCNKDFILIIKNKIRSEHNFDYENPNFIPVDLDITDLDVNSFIKINKLLNLNSNIKNISDIKSIIDSENKIKLCELNFNSDIKILEIVYETSRWIRE